MADKPTNQAFTIDATAIERWAAEIAAEAGATTRLYVNLALKNGAGIVLRREFKEAPRGVTGGLVKSVRQIVTEAIAVIGPKSKYAIYIEKGTKPHMPPIDAITPWAESKGINPWAVAMSIKKKGTVANPFVERTFKGSKAEVVAEFAIATKLITSALAKKGGTI